MNNLVAQQRGFSAEAGDAVNVANLMGKAMMGMTSALRRVVYPVSPWDEYGGTGMRTGDQLLRAM